MTITFKQDGEYDSWVGRSVYEIHIGDEYVGSIYIYDDAPTSVWVFSGHINTNVEFDTKDLDVLKTLIGCNFPELTT